MPLDTIPVRVVTPDAGLSGNARPLLMEIAERVRRLVEEGEPSAIDLSALPLTPADKDWLRARLGQGEIRVSLEAAGTSLLEESACPGVWWVTHRDVQERVLSEFIEITHVPDLVPAHPRDIKTGLEYLESVIYRLD
ncbi:MAG TPA: hydrogenase expression/formation protein [Thiobacillaceae bacterium]|nr:hydrogenase expression/formation protein [Thiobacillaceae bacterium]HNU64045.1 hydrogenase expression/formation protein [Thiobacillaceae bacterium]